jgi:hypothetical protein
MDKLLWQREYRKRNKNCWTHKYEKSPKGFLVRLYRNMQSRVTGVQVKKAHLYKGLFILPRDEFYQWALGHPDFNQLFQTWEANQYARKLTPTVDRIDSSVGYELSNMRWLTHSVNSSRRLNAGS